MDTVACYFVREREDKIVIPVLSYGLSYFLRASWLHQSY